MRKGWIVLCVCTLAFVSAAAFAQTPSVAPLASEVLAAILGQSVTSEACPAPRNDTLFAAKKPAKPGQFKSCSATANCETGTVTCSVSGSGTCQAFNRDCSIGERGHVVCNGVTTNCPTTCGGGCTPPVWCCQCDQTGDCFACCRCNGGGPGQCIQECG